jgi:hypothetical protein
MESPIIKIATMINKPPAAVFSYLLYLGGNIQGPCCWLWFSLFHALGAMIEMRLQEILKIISCC